MINNHYLEIENFLKKKINEVDIEDQEILSTAGSISDEAKVIHANLLKKINKLIPFPQIYREIYTWPQKYFLELGGSILKDENGIKHPLVGFGVGNLLAKIDIGKKNTKGKFEEDYFEHVIAHEYGHIIFDLLTSETKNKINKILKRVNPYTDFKDSELACSPEINEGYAFWFGDYFSEADTNFRKVNYGNLHKPLMIKTHKILTSLSKSKGIEKCFDPDILANSLFSCEKKAEDLRGFPLIRY